MNAQDHTFIDAYGLETNGQLPASHGEPTRPGVHEAVPVASRQPMGRSTRFDAAARRCTLQGPHFDTRRVISQQSDKTSGWDTLDMGVIDVGAAWTPAPVIVQPSFEEQPVTIPPSRAVKPATKTDVTEVVETVETEEKVVTVAAPVAAQAEVAKVDAEELASQEQRTTAESKVPAAEDRPQSVDLTEPFAPAWEVDRFHWPDDIEQLFTTQAEYFAYAGQKLVAASREGLNILAITSTRPGEGSTTLALCLARAAAGAGAKVGLLDGNLIRSELGSKLGVDFASGWQSAATREQPLAESAITGLEEGITLFPSATGPVAEIESLGDKRVGQVLRAAAASYDLLIVDAGRADLGSNVDALDAAIVVRDVRHTSESETLTVAAALRNRGVKAVGIAENFGNSQTARAAA